MATAPLDLLHVDFTSIETTFAKFLYQGYISIFVAPARVLSDRGANVMTSVIDEMFKIFGMREATDHILQPTD